MKHGIDPYIQHKREKSNAVDSAYNSNDIAALRILDVKGKYTSYLNSFKAPNNSPFLGSWTNKKDEFDMFTISFHQNGKADVFISIGSANRFWRETKKNTCEIFTAIHAEELKNNEFTCIYNPENDTITATRKTFKKEYIEVLYRKQV